MEERKLLFVCVCVSRNRVAINLALNLAVAKHYFFFP